MKNGNVLQFDLNDLPMDVFQLADRGLTVESLTAGHGMAENGASHSSSFCSGFCGGHFCGHGGGGGGGSCSCSCDC